MFQIVDKDQLSENVYRLEVQAPRIAKAYRPGQFAILRIDENGERIPLTIALARPAEGLITFIIQAIGFTTRQLCGLKAGDVITADVVRSVRPGFGLPPKFLPVFLGKRVAQNVECGQPCSWDLLVQQSS